MNMFFLSNVPTPYQLDFILELRKKNKVFCFFLWGSGKNCDWVLNKNDIYIANFNKLNIFHYLKFLKIVLAFKPGLLIIGGYRLPFFYFSVLLSKILGFKTVLWLESPFPAKRVKKLIKDVYIRLRVYLVDFVFCIGKKAGSIYSKVTQKDIYNLPYSSSLDRFYDIRRENGKYDEIVFLFSGQLIERKNILNLLKAFSSIDDKGIVLKIIGAGPLKSLVLDFVSNDKRIKYLGFVQPKDLSEVFGSADVFILPSLFDGWGVVITEAMASAMPIIGTAQCGAITEYIDCLNNGYICKPDAESIKKAFEYYLKNRDKIYLHGNINRNIIKKSLADVNNSVIALANYVLTPRGLPRGYKSSSPKGR